ncbi:TetR/AcrR family transcriptional regulator [Roseovarius nitratireducens]|uniref:TetR/AcrR family transcriptional regulator n=1 Tax=Roseovarius nitratireducens TaxID=2044597 RepID=UPI000CE2407E|nr:TetR/AcrR family transcriptional regulator [Roseovarius nitratireducens]
MSNLVKQPRRTQTERSDRTRRLLHEATIALLMEVGYSNTTSLGIAKRAGVSRGAQTHHYPEKIDLIVAATEDMFDAFAEGLSKQATELRSGTLSLDDFLARVWMRMLEGDWFYASLEIIVAARGDEELRRRLQPAIFSLHSRFESIWRETFAPTPGSDLDPAVVMNIVMNMCRGMAVQAVLRPDRDFLHDMLKVMAVLLRERVKPIVE